MLTGDTSLLMKNEFGYTTIKTFDELMQFPNDIVEKYSVLTECGYSSFKEIQKQYDRRELIILTLNDNAKLKCTPEHLVVTYDNEIKMVKDLKLNDSLKGFGLRVIGNEYVNDNAFPVYEIFGIEASNSYFTEKILSWFEKS